MSDERAALTLHMKCRHPEAIRSGSYQVLDSELTGTDAGTQDLDCDVCGESFDKESALIVHSWSHLAEAKVAKAKRRRGRPVTAQVKQTSTTQAKQTNTTQAKQTNEKGEEGPERLETKRNLRVKPYDLRRHQANSTDGPTGEQRL